MKCTLRATCEPQWKRRYHPKQEKNLLFLSGLKADRDGTCVFLMGTLPPFNLLLSLTLAKVTRSPATEQFHVELLRFVQPCSPSPERSRTAVAPAAQGRGRGLGALTRTDVSGGAGNANKAEEGPEAWAATRAGNGTKPQPRAQPFANQEKYPRQETQKPQPTRNSIFFLQVRGNLFYSVAFRRRWG